MAFKTFEADLATEDGEPIQFQLAGHTFTRRAVLPLGALVMLARARRTDGTLEQLAALDEVIRAWLIPEDLDAWDEVLVTITKLSVLDEVITYMLEATTGRPTSALSTSSTSA